MVVLARPVRAIGGPMGPVEGPAGPFGPLSPLALGAVGPTGPFGRLGATGPVGPAGILTELLGPVGSKGPLGSGGWLGNTGATGTAALCPDETYVRYYENTDGHKNFQPQGNYVGCKFTYSVKGYGFTFVMFTGIFTSTSALPIDIGLYIGGYAGNEAPPNAGDRSLGGTAGSGFVTLVAPPQTKIPFFIMTMSHTYPYYPETKMFPFPRWYDLAAAHGNSGFDPAGGVINKISCCILEVAYI